MGSLLRVAGSVGGVNLRNPIAVLQSQVPLLAAVDFPDAALVSSPDADKAGEKVIPALTKECLVCVYNPHTGETQTTDAWSAGRQARRCGYGSGRLPGRA